MTDRKTALALAGAYGDALADLYDTMFPTSAAAAQAADLLAGLCPSGGRVLEMGVGTGRIAIPLAERGLRVHGVEASARMLDKLAEKDPDRRVTPVHDDFLSVRLDERFDVVSFPFNSFCCVATQQDQVDLLLNARRHLAPGGHVVIELFDPSEFHTQPRAGLTTYPLGPTGVVLEATHVMRSTQTMVLAGTILTGDGPPRNSWCRMRYVWPSELDLMARLAGLEPVDRWSGWDREPVAEGSAVQVSLYRAAE